MAGERLVVSDVDVQIGPGHLAAHSPPPPCTAPGPPLTIERAWERRLSLLEARIVLLERRTWWSMLVDWVRTWGWWRT